MYSALQYRSGRIVPISRLTLAATFIGTSWVDPDYPLWWESNGPSILLAYLGFAIVLAVIAWRDWWLDHQLRVAAFVTEALFAFGVLFMIERSPGGAASPFMALFVFLLVTGSLIWRQKQLVIVSILLLVGYCATVAAMKADGAVIDGHWVIRRVAFMTVTAALVIWFGQSRGKPRAERLDWSIDDSIEERFAIITEYIRNHIRTSGISLIWMPENEPWTFLRAGGLLGERQLRISPEDYDFSFELPGEAILFDRRRSRALILARRGGITARRGVLPIPLATYLDVNFGLYVPITAETGMGALLLVGKQVLTPDHLQPAAIIGQEIALALDRHEINAMTKAAEIASLRENLARDLHDSVVQTLVGESLRLGVLRTKLAEGQDITDELGVLHESIDQEQRNVQRIIGRLHDTAPRDHEADLAATIAETLARLGRQWGLDIALDVTSTQQLVPEALAHEFELLLREAIANAVRHGRATSAKVRARIVGREVRLTVIDNGTGFPTSGEARFPRSITQRVQSLGGTVDISTSGDDTTLSIVIPGVREA